VAEYGGAVYGIIPAAIEQAQAAAAHMVAAGSVTYEGTVLSTTLKIVGIDLTCLGESTADGAEYVVLRIRIRSKECTNGLPCARIRSRARSCWGIRGTLDRCSD
jgi:NAD(P)H-nitrite reductase large subunit